MYVAVLPVFRIDCKIDAVFDVRQMRILNLFYYCYRAKKYTANIHEVRSFNVFAMSIKSLFNTYLILHTNVLRIYIS